MTVFGYSIVGSIRRKAKKATKVDMAGVKQQLPVAWALGANVILSWAANTVSALLFILGIYLYLNGPHPTAINGTYQQFLSLAWPVDVALAALPLTLGIVLFQTRWDTPARHIVFRYALAQTRLQPVAIVGVISNGLLFSAALETLKYGAISGPLLWTAVGCLGILLCVAAWSIIGTLRSLHPDRLSYFTENALRLVIRQSLSALILQQYFDDHMRKETEPFGIEALALDILPIRDAWPVRRTGFVRDVFLVLRREDAAVAPHYPYGAIHVHLGQEVKRGQLLATATHRNRTDPAKHVVQVARLNKIMGCSVVFVSRRKRTASGTLDSELNYLLDSVRESARNPAQGRARLRMLLNVLIWTDTAVSTVSNNTIRYGTTMKRVLGAFYEVARIVRGTAMEKEFVQAVGNLMFQGLPSFQSVHALTQLIASLGGAGPDYAQSYLQAYIDLYIPEFLLREPDRIRDIVGLAEAGLSSWIEHIRSCPEDTTELLSSFIAVYDEPFDRDQYGWIEIYNAKQLSLIQLCAWWIYREENDGTPTCFPKVWHLLSPFLSLDIVEESMQAIQAGGTESSLGQLFYRWTRDLAKRAPSPDQMGITSSTLETQLKILRALLKRSRGRELTNEEGMLLSNHLLAQRLW